MKTVSTVFIMVLFVTSASAAPKEKVLHGFNDGRGGALPNARLALDAAGNLYGTTTQGGAYNNGTVFMLTPKAAGGWTEKVLHNFNLNGRDGVNPFSGGLIFDASGNLYGTTYQGGTYNKGTVFELTPQTGGGWTEKVLHSFNPNGKDGTGPLGLLTLDGAGDLYGTAGGGVYNDGTVFELTPRADGGWVEKVLHSFNPDGTDGLYPEAGVTIDAAGHLYGTTSNGGAYGYGTVFELTPRAGGSWTEKVIHNFNDNGMGGTNPYAGLIIDQSGNLYGATVDFGTQGAGTVFELMPQSGGGWLEKVLHQFNPDGRDGIEPMASLVFDTAGNLYGTMVYGGAYGEGTVFELTPQAGGGWTQKVVHHFNSNGKDGQNPIGGLILDTANNLFGTTYRGGTQTFGTVFEITP
jgi:uncharacterized repeat protein (TIGR03803 family)